MRIARCPSCSSRWAPGLVIDVERHTVAWPGGRVTVRPKEAAVLAVLADAAGAVCRRTRIIDALWSHEYDGGPDNAGATISVHVYYLRRALAAAGFPGHIRTQACIGYELVLQG